MDFNFDSSPSDNEDIDLDEFDDTGLLALSSRQEAAAQANSTAAARSPKKNDSADSEAGDDGGNVDWEDGESDVDWEDADDENGTAEYISDEDLDRKMPALPTQGVTVTFSSVCNTPEEPVCMDTKQNNEPSTQNEEPVKNTKKRKRVHVLKDVPHHTQQLILDVRRSHMLCCVARSMKCSSICSTCDVPTQNCDDDESRAMLLSLAYSLIPEQFHACDGQGTNSKDSIPTNHQLREFTLWFFEFANAAERRRETVQQNVARGAVVSPVHRKRARKSASNISSKKSRKSRRDQADETGQPNATPTDSPTVESLTTKLAYLSPYYDDDPQLFINDGTDVIGLVENISALEKTLLMLVLVRSLRWRARFVSALDPLPLQLTVDHPLLGFNKNVKGTMAKASLPKSSTIVQMIRLMKEGGMLKQSNSDAKKPGRSTKRNSNTSKREKEDDAADSAAEQLPEKQLLCWIEVLCSDDGNGKAKQLKSSSQKQSTKKHSAKWVAIFPHEKSYDTPLDAEVFLTKLEENISATESVQVNAKQSAQYKKARLNSRKAPKRKPVSYVLAVEHSQAPNINHLIRFTDVTPRYASMWSHTLRLRGAAGKELAQSGGKCVDKWWTETLKVMNRQYLIKPTVGAHSQRGSAILDRKPAAKAITQVSVTKSRTSDGREVEVLELASTSEEEHFDHSDHDDIDHSETKELSANIAREPMPKSKAAFKQHPQYVIPSVLNSTEVLHPEARKHICGVFKGEMVYRRQDVSKALRSKKWLYKGRKVKEKELDNPIKQVKARRKKSQGFQALESYVDSNEEALPIKYSNDEDTEMDNLYGIWQTKPWRPPPVGPNDPIPVNEYKNVELALLNPGLTHMEQPRLSVVARKLGIQYAPCMCGYEGHRGNQTPTVRGIVVHSHNVDLLNEAYMEYQSQLVESEVEARRQDILKKWKRLVFGIMTKDRLDKAYG